MLYNLHIMQIRTKWTKFELNSVQSLGFHLPCPVGWSTVCVTRPLSSSSSSSSLLPSPSSSLSSAVHIPPVSRALVQFPFYKLSNSATLSFPDSEPIPTPDFVICFFHDKQTLTLWVSYSNEKKEVLKIIFILISWTNILFWLVGQRELSTAAG